MRTTAFYTLENPEKFKEQLLEWSNQFREVTYLNSNKYPDQYSEFDTLLAIECFTLIKTDYNSAFQKLTEYQKTTNDWIFGYLSYDLKNDTELLKSLNFDGLDFADLLFYQPKKIFIIKDNILEMQYLKMVDDEFEYDFNEILNTEIPDQEEIQNIVNIKQRISKQEYLHKVSQVLNHIQLGDIYEANFCMEYYSEDSYINPIKTYQRLNKISEAPFSSFFRCNDHYIICSSPERYLKHKDNKIISQPIKGTAKRSSDSELDLKIKNELESNEKERSENIMIVDLVRNDLSRTAEKKSVEVNELCKAYSFKQVHHLISTISSNKNKESTVIEVIEKSFPMGSMTGAPKISAMEIIEKTEETKRGVYSGSIGYFTPEGNFDFNVIIRSILYNSKNKYLSFSVGSAITSKCDPNQEYEECLLKAQAMLKVLNLEN